MYRGDRSPPPVTKDDFLCSHLGCIYIQHFSSVLSTVYCRFSSVCSKISATVLMFPTSAMKSASGYFTVPIIKAEFRWKLVIYTVKVTVMCLHLEFQILNNKTDLSVLNGKIFRVVSLAEKSRNCLPYNSLLVCLRSYFLFNSDHRKIEFFNFQRLKIPCISLILHFFHLNLTPFSSPTWGIEGSFYLAQDQSTPKRLVLTIN